MKLHFDKDADALYLKLDESAIIESEPVSDAQAHDDAMMHSSVSQSMAFLLRLRKRWIGVQR
jgi:hypothetical protein